jgi:hypothetical protein
VFTKLLATYGVSSLHADVVRGPSEIRLIFGRLLIVLGIAPFIIGVTAYPVLGIAYPGIDLTRAISINIDES